jgi:hypothetical protein
MTNSVTSIQAKLRNLAQVDGKNYQLILIRYFQERLIYRLSVSNYCDNFCLKGGALLYALEQEKSRPTLDIDLLGLRMSPEQLHLKQVFTEICQKNDQQDGVTFNLATLVTSEIAKEGKYSGVRIKVDALLGTMRQTLFKMQHPLFNESFATDTKRLIQWQAFLRKSKLNETLDFQIVMKMIQENLFTIYEQV